METHRTRDEPIKLERNTLDAILGNIGPIIVIGVIVVIVIVGLIYARTRYKIAKADEALVITGGKKGPQVYQGGGAFVSPFRKHQVFPISVMTVRSSDQETQSKTLVPVIVKWTAQLRPDTETEGALLKAVIGFSGLGNDDHISASLQQTLDGEIRAVVATLTPEEVVTGKDEFARQVRAGVSEQMTNLGFTLVSLNIAEVSDNNGYYKNLAAKDREAQRQTAETLTAAADREVAVAQAAANQVSESAVLDKDLAVAAKSRDVAVQKAAFKVEVDSAEKDAEFSGQLQGENRQKELATRKGEVKVIEVQQEQAAAVARREVELTDADTARQKLAIEAEAAAKKLEIDTAAAAKKQQIVAEADAKAVTTNAEGTASAAVATAKGVADAKNLDTEATARNEREVGLAKAAVVQAQGEAEAAAILARGTSEAEAQRLMADALAANEGANLHVTLAEIDSKTRITIATQTATVMAEIGKNAKFVDMGAGSGAGKNVLSNVLGTIPSLLATLDVESDALNGASFGGALGAALAALKNGEPAVASEPVVPASTSIGQPAGPTEPAPANSTSQAGEESEPETAPVIEQPASAEQVEAPAADQSTVITSETIDAIRAQADKEGVSLDELAARYGVNQPTLERILSEKLAPGDLLDQGLQVGKKTQSSRKKN